MRHLFLHAVVYCPDGPVITMDENGDLMIALIAVLLEVFDHHLERAILAIGEPCEWDKKSGQGKSGGESDRRSRGRRRSDGRKTQGKTQGHLFACVAICGPYGLGAPVQEGSNLHETIIHVFFQVFDNSLERTEMLIVKNRDRDGILRLQAPCTISRAKENLYLFIGQAMVTNVCKEFIGKSLIKRGRTK